METQPGLAGAAGRGRGGRPGHAHLRVGPPVAVPVPTSQQLPARQGTSR